MYELTQNEIEKTRTKEELNDWINDTLNKFDSENSIKSFRLSSTPIIKVFKEESLILNGFCKHFFKNTNNILLKQIVGNQNYDVEVNNFHLFSYIEITIAHDGQSEKLRNEILNECGSVPAYTTIRRIGKKNSHYKIEYENVAIVGNSGNNNIYFSSININH